MTRTSRRLTRFVPLTLAVLALSVPVLADDDDGGGLTFRARLSGANEFPNPVNTRARGEAKLEVDLEDGTVRYRLEFNAKDASGMLGVAGAHIHCAPEGANGPVVMFLSGVITGGVVGKFEIRGTLTAANITNPACGATLEALAASMRDGRTYVNVHSLTYPGGEIRGQLAPEGDDDDD